MPGINIKIVIPAKAGIQYWLIILDSPVSRTGQALRRATLARNDEKAIATQSTDPGYRPFNMIMLEK
jgi:hypothetical protein